MKYDPKILEQHAASLLEIGAKHGFSSLGLQTLKDRLTAILAELSPANPVINVAEITTVEPVKPVKRKPKAAV